MDNEIGDSWAPLEFRDMPVQAPPSPWASFVCRDESYLTHLGFSKDCTHCQVVSDHGVSVLSLPSLVLVHNEPESAIEIEYPTLLMGGVGPLKGEGIRFAGRFGGGLSYQDGDGSLCEPVHIAGTCVAVFLKPNASAFDLSFDVLANPHTKIFEGDPVIAAGFCPCNNHMVIATSRSIRVSTRQSCA